MLKNKSMMLGFLIWGICAVFFAYEFLLRTVLGTFQHPIMADLQLTPMSFAILSSTAYLTIYALMQIPVGLLADRFGLKKTLSLAVLICALATLLFAFSYQFHSAVLARMLMGLGSSFGFICLLVAVYDWLPTKNTGLFIGLSQFIGTLGPMMAAGPLNTMATNANTPWRTIFMALGGMGLLLFVIVLLVVKNNTSTVDKFRIIQKPTSAKTHLRALLKQKQVWLIALFSALTYFTLEYLSENEGKSFIVLNGYSEVFASYMITLGWLGYAVGCPCLGLISDLAKNRRYVMIFAAITAFCALTVIIFFPVSKALLTLAFFFLGIGAAGQSIGFAIIAEQCTKAYLALGLGFNNGMIMLMASVNAPLIGALLSFSHQQQTASLSDYYLAFSVMFGLLALAIIVSTFFIKETFCRSTKGFTVIG